MSKIEYSLEGKLAQISMDDGKANALDPEWFQEMNTALDRALEEKAECLLIAGREGLFCGGLNLKLMPTLSPEELMGMVTAFGRTMMRIFTFPIPTAAVLTGHTMAGGVQLALSCDRRFILDGPFRFQMNETVAGMIFPTWMLKTLTQVIPVQRQVELLLHSRAYTPAETVEFGLCDVLIPQGEDAVAKAREGCADLLALDVPSYAYTKSLLRPLDVEGLLSTVGKELMRK